MASTHQEKNRDLYRGVNQSVGRHQIADGEVWNLLNFKPDEGKLVATAPLIEAFTLNNLTGESSQSQIKLLQLVRNLSSNLRYFIINNKTARYVDPTSPATQVQIPVVTQVNKPNNATVTGECLLYGFNLTDFAATNDQIDVEIQTATTFRWRRNAGSWTSGLVIAAEVSLGANGLKVSFQTTTGYTAGNVWSWKRSATHPYTGADATTASFPLTSAVYNKDIYVGGLERNVMRLRDDFLTSVGYSRAYGKYVCVFQGHLVIGQYAPGVYHAINGIADSYNPATTPFNIGWSHLSNPDQFFSTDVNEADEYSFPQQAAHDWSNVGLTGLGELSDQLYAYLPDAIKVGVYVGLPTVMQFRTVNPRIGNLFSSGLVIAARGHYFIGRDDVYKFTGTELTPIGAKIFTKLMTEMVPVTDTRYQMLTGSYDEDNGEVIFTYWINPTGSVYQARQAIYIEKTGEWYFRNLPSASASATDIYCQTKLPATWGKRVYGGSGIVYQDWVTGTGGTYVKDDCVTVPVTPQYTTPTIETRVDYYGTKRSMKEFSQIALDYVFGTGTALAIKVEATLSRTIARIAAYTLFGSFNPEGSTHVGDILTGKKLNARVIGYKFSVGDGTAPVRDATFCGYGEFIYGTSTITEK